MLLLQVKAGRSPQRRNDASFWEQRPGLPCLTKICDVPLPGNSEFRGMTRSFVRCFREPWRQDKDRRKVDGALRKASKNSEHTRLNGFPFALYDLFLFLQKGY